MSFDINGLDLSGPLEQIDARIKILRWVQKMHSPQCENFALLSSIIDKHLEHRLTMINDVSASE